MAPSADYLSIEGEGKLRATASLVQQKETKYGPSHLDLEEKLERRAGREKRKEIKKLAFHSCSEFGNRVSGRRSLGKLFRLGAAAAATTTADSRATRRELSVEPAACLSRTTQGTKKRERERKKRTRNSSPRIERFSRSSSGSRPRQPSTLPMVGRILKQ